MRTDVASQQTVFGLDIADGLYGERNRFTTSFLIFFLH